MAGWLESAHQAAGAHLQGLSAIPRPPPRRVSMATAAPSAARTGSSCCPPLALYRLRWVVLPGPEVRAEVLSGPLGRRRKPRSVGGGRGPRRTPSPPPARPLPSASRASGPRPVPAPRPGGPRSRGGVEALPERPAGGRTASGGARRLSAKPLRETALASGGAAVRGGALASRAGPSALWAQFVLLLPSDTALASGFLTCPLGVPGAAGS